MQDGRSVVTMLRGDPSARTIPPILRIPTDSRRRQTNAERYHYYHQEAKKKRRKKNIRHKVRKLHAPIPRTPQTWVNRGVPIYDGQYVQKTALNEVLHIYPELISLYLKPTPNYTILTPYLQSQYKQGYKFFPNKNTKEWNSHTKTRRHAPTVTRRSSRSRSRDSSTDTNSLPNSTATSSPNSYQSVNYINISPRRSRLNGRRNNIRRFLQGEKSINNVIRYLRGPFNNKYKNKIAAVA